MGVWWGRVQRGAEIPHPQPMPVVVVEDSPEMEEYRVVARRIGFLPASLPDPTLDRVLQQLGIDVFPFQEVEVYLKAVADRLNPWPPNTSFA